MACWHMGVKKYLSFLEIITENLESFWDYWHFKKKSNWTNSNVKKLEYKMNKIMWVFLIQRSGECHILYPHLEDVCAWTKGLQASKSCMSASTISARENLGNSYITVLSWKDCVKRNNSPFLMCWIFTSTLINKNIKKIIIDVLFRLQRDFEEISHNTSQKYWIVMGCKLCCVESLQKLT